MSNIRLTYSGLLSFLLTIVSIFTGLVFVMIVTRRLDQTHFAMWSLIGGIIAYSMSFSSISNYWLARHIARGEKESVTGIFSAIILSIAAIGVYFIATLILSNSSDVDFKILLFAVLLVPLSYIVRAFSTITSSYKPQGVSYSALVFEITKIPIGFILVYILDLGIIGAITTAAISHLAQLLFYVVYSKERLNEQFHYGVFKSWLKLSWLPVFAALHDRIINLDSTIYTMISGSVTGVAFIGIAKTIGNLVSNTSSISVGLAPKLLATPDIQHAELMMNRILLFAIPALGFTITFAKPSLWVLNPIYVDAVNIVYLWSISHFTWVIYGIFTSTLESLERVDIGFKAKTKEYLKSRLFTVRLVFVVGYSAYIVILTLVFMVLSKFESDTLETIFWWGVIYAVSNISILIVFSIMTARQISFKFPVRKTMKYTIVTLFSCSITYFLISKYLEYEESILEFGPNLIPYMLLFGGLYFGLVMLWDNDSRKLFQQIFQELKK